MKRFFKSAFSSKSFKDQITSILQKIDFYKIRDYAETASRKSLNGISETAIGIYGNIFITKSKIQELEEDLIEQGQLYTEVVLNKKDKRIVDSLIVSLELHTLEKIKEIFPMDILEAYSLQFPNLSDKESLYEWLRSHNDDQIVGIANGIKGKLFELDYLDYLNNGNLPDGYFAELAESPNQSGWDIKILNEHGEVDSLLQNKAVDSISYVTQALEKYPHIPVVTTEEVYAELQMTAYASNTVNSEISFTELSDYVDSELEDASLNISDFSPPVLTLALLAFSSYRRKDMQTFDEKYKDLFNRYGRAYASQIVGMAAIIVTNSWWLGIASSVSSRFFADKGLRRFYYYSEMKKSKRNCRSVLKRVFA